MDEAMRLHDDCVRRLLRTHSGYESANEGDSFIMAFHSVRDAVAFSMALQLDLMDLPWPAQ
ncbi:adenylate cyclase, partial [Haematococcus lacustris]